MYTSQCVTDYECISRKCDCPQKIYYHGTGCAQRKTYLSACSVTDECDYPNRGLSCVNSVCNCLSSIEYFSNGVCGNLLNQSDINFKINEDCYFFNFHIPSRL